MKKTKKNWLTGSLVVLTILLMIGIATFALLGSTQNAYAENVVGSVDASTLYPSGTTTKAMTSYTSSAKGKAGSETLSGKGTYSWSGGSLTMPKNGSFQIAAGATFTMTVTNMVNPEHVLYSRVFAGSTNESQSLTLTISFGGKNESVTFNSSTSGGDAWYPDLKGGGGSSITWTIKNNSGSAYDPSSGYLEYYVARNYTVNFNKNGGTGGTNSTSVWHHYAYDNITVPTKSGYRFLGYFDATSGGTKYYKADGTPAKTAWDKGNSEVTSIDLYAQWEIAEQTVNVSAGTGVNSVYLSTNQNATSGSASGSKFSSGATVYAFAVLKAGYKHKSGWTRVSGTEDTAGAKYRVSSQTVGTSTVNFGSYSADLITYTITYNTNGGTHGSNHPSSYNVTTNTFTISNPTKTGYTFAGWTGTGLSSATTSLSVAKGSIGSRTYTATWTANKYTINYYDEAGVAFTGTTNNNPAKHTYDTATNLVAPSREGHTFIGWYLDSACTDEPVTTIGATQFLNSFNLYAKWTHPVTIVAGKGISAVYLSTKQYALTGDVSGTQYNYNTQHYGYAVLKRGYNAPTEWKLISGTSNSEDAIYRIGLGTVTEDGYDFGTVNAIANQYYVYLDEEGEKYVVGTYGEKLPTILPQDFPVRTGYTFMGYYYEPEEGEAVQYYNPNGTGSREWDHIETRTLTPHWEKTKYTITCNLDGGVANNPATYTYFDQDITLTNPTKTGYTFVGWTGTGLEEKTMTVVISAGSLGNKNFTANYTINQYTITFNSNNGSAVDPITQNYATPVQAPAAPSRTGYTFGGWYANEELTTGYIFTTIPAENITVYAKWNVITYSLSYTMNGGTATNPASYNIESEAITLNNPTKTGYTFNGWTGTDIDEMSTTVVIANGSIGDRAYEAHFTANTYQVTIGEDEIDVVYDSAMPEVVAPTQTGYTFVGYFDAETEGTKYYNDDGTSARNWDKDSDATLYPHFTANEYQVTVNGHIYTATFDQEMPALNAVDVLSKEGHTFNGYFYQPQEGDPIKYYNADGTSAQNWDIPAAAELIESFTINQYTITFVTNGGSAVDAITQDYDTVVTAPDAPTKTGYIFGGWLITTQPETIYVFSTMPAENITLNAKWTAKTYTVTLENGNVTATYDAILPGNMKPTKAGHTFHGYFDEEDGQGNKYVDEDGTGVKTWDKDENFTLKAYWTINSYKVYITEDSGTKEVYTALTDISKSGNPSGTEYTYGTTVYAYAVLAGGYTAPSNWILVQGVYNTDGALYIIGSVTVPDEDYDFSAHYATEGIPSIYLAVLSDERVFEVTFGEPMADLEAQDIPADNENPGYTFDGYKIGEEKYIDKDGKGVRNWDIQGVGHLEAIWVPKTYTVTIGEVQIAATYLAEMPAIDVPTRTGYTFGGVFDQANGQGNKYYTNDGTSTRAWDKTQDTELLIYWIINQYTITFVTNGGSVIAPITQNYDTNINQADPTKDGYTFGGWYSDEELTAAYTLTKIPAVDITVYAKWNIVTYTITYTLNDGAVATANPASYTVESEDITLNNPTKTGYTFDGWTGTDLAAMSTDVVIATGSIGDRTYVANYTIKQYTITFVTNGGSVIAPITQNYDTVINQANPTKDGYIFGGWYSNEGLTAAYTLTKIPAEDITVYAKWNIVTYPIVYTLNGGSVSAGNPEDYNAKSADITLNNPTKTGYTFDGWTGTGIVGMSTNVVITTGSSGDRSYEAHFTANTYQVTIGETEIDVDYDSAMPQIIAPTQTGYTFVGYFDEENGQGTQYYNADGMSAHIWDKDGDATLYPYFTANQYNVTVNEHVYVATYDQPLPTLNAVDVLSQTGYTFNGYYYQPQEGDPIKYYNADGTSAHDWDITENVTLAPLFTINQYTISFAVNGGSAVEAIIDDYNEDVNAPDDPTKDGYTFGGWYEDENFESEYEFTTIPAEDITVYAKWNIVTYTITYTLNDGTVATANPISYTVESEDITLNNPTKTGYDFDGWTGTGIDGMSTNVVIVTGSIGDRAYEAHFTAITYQVTIGEDEIDVVYDSAMPEVVAPTQTGYTFIGYFDEENGQGTQYYNADGTSAHIWDKDGDATLYPYFTANQYEITVNGHAYTVTFDEEMPAITEDDILSQEGYTFNGYYYQPQEGDPIKYYNADGTSAHDWDITENVTLAPLFTINQYTISFAVNGGSAVEAIIDDYNKDVDAPDDPTKDGYTFGGWYEDENFESEYEFTTIPAEDITVYAKWNIVNYTITYTLSDGTVATANPISYTVESEDITLNNPTKTGYDFDGWTGTDLNAMSTNVVIVTGSIGDRAYEAHFTAITYQVTIGEDEIDVVYDSAMPQVDAPTQTGYTFVGYFDQENGQGTQYYNANGTSAHNWDKDGDATLYPYFTANEYEITVNGHAYTVTFDEEMPAITEDDILFQEGYTFNGYYYQPQEGDPIKYYNADGTSAHNWDKDSDITLYPYFTANEYEITINGHTYTVTFDEEMPAITEDDILFQEGYTFNGYYYQPQEGDPIKYYNADGTSAHDWDIIEDITLTPSFTINQYTITFAANGGSDVDAITDDYDRDVEVPTDPTRTGYTFGGWYADEELTTEYTLTKIPAKNITVYAKWNVIPYVITYTLNGGVATNPTSYSIESNDITIVNPTKDGYTFIGWTGTELEEKTLRVSIRSGSMGNRDYVAYWEQNVMAIADEEKGIRVETEDAYGIPTDIELVVEVKTNVSTSEGQVDHSDIQAKLKSNEHVAKVFDVKLIKTENGVETEIQPSDIKDGMKIKVKILIPEEVSLRRMRVLHVHSADDMEYIEDYTIEDGYLIFETDRLSEFVFINTSIPLWILLLVIAAVLFLICLIIILSIMLSRSKHKNGVLMAKKKS